MKTGESEPSDPTSRNDSRLSSLTIRRLIPARPEQVFDAWTDPDALKLWWGPKGVRCLSAEVDLTAGGEYRIENRLPDKSILWIVGRFEVVNRPDSLIYTWGIETPAFSTERVSVKFSRHHEGTEIILLHEKIPNRLLAEQHEHGWNGCCDALHSFLAAGQGSDQVNLLNS